MEVDEKARKPERRDRRREKLEDIVRRGWVRETWARKEVEREIAEAKERKARRRRMEDDRRKKRCRRREEEKATKPDRRRKKKRGRTRERRSEGEEDRGMRGRAPEASSSQRVEGKKSGLSRKQSKPAFGSIGKHAREGVEHAAS